MNILFVQDVVIKPNAGGLERVTYVLSKEFAARGHNIKFLCVGKNSENIPDFTEFRQLYLSLHDFAPESFKAEYLRLLKQFDIDLVIFQDVGNANFRVLKSTPKEVLKYIVFHNQPFAHLGKEAEINRLTPFQGLSLKRKILKIICYFSPRIYKRLNGNHLRAYYSEIANAADRFIMLADCYKDRIISAANGMVNENKIDAIVNPITFEPDYDDMEKENIILFVGRLTNPQKNVTGFMDVWSRLSKKLPRWKAVVLGEGEHRRLIENYKKKLKLENIEFKGNVSNIRDYYKKASILCMTSSYEGWPMVLMEAMSFGCLPVVYDTFEAVHDIIDDGNDGLIIKKFDVSEMTAGILNLIRDEDKRQKMVQSGKEKITNFKVESIADFWEKRFRTDRPELS